jgi:hypothetical protein
MHVLLGKNLISPLQNKETSDTKLGKFHHLTNNFLKEQIQGQLA